LGIDAVAAVVADADAGCAVLVAPLVGPPSWAKQASTRPSSVPLKPVESISGPCSSKAEHVSERR
jgi:hypothetical protein